MDRPFAIYVDTADPGLMESELQTAEFSVRFGDLAFPAPDWDDFVVIVLTWWCKEAASSLRGANSAEFLFMDGDYWFRVSVNPDSASLVSLFEHDTVTQAFRSDPLRIISLIILNAAKSVLERLVVTSGQSNEVSLTRDVSALNSAVAELDTLLNA